MSDYDILSMAEILEKCPTADRFSLNLPYGNFRVSEKIADEALKKISTEMQRFSKMEYDTISEEERAKLPDFDTLYKEIADECAAYRATIREQIESRGGHAFFCDRFARDEAKYKQPMTLWHVYHSVDFVEYCAYRLNELKKVKEERALDSGLEKFPALKNALMNTEVTFAWHCTVSGELMRVFTFTLNDETKAWLLSHENDYELTCGDDLALYAGDKILFSSCTHEGFHNFNEEE